MTATSCGIPPFRYVQYTDAKGTRFLLSSDDLLSIKSAYIDSLIPIFAACYFLSGKFMHSSDKISPCAGGNGQNNNESKLIKIRQTISESDLMKIPPSSACNSYTIVSNSDKSGHFDDITLLSEIPPVSICVKKGERARQTPKR